MGFAELSASEISEKVGQRHEVTGVEYAEQGLQPYYQWLMRTLELLSQASAGAMRVGRDEASVTGVYVAPGRASIGGVVLVYGGGSLELGAFNNDTAYVWLRDESGEAVVEAGADGSGWPGGVHIKLAEVTLVEGKVVDVLDRRFETILKA